ncbi:MAG TPA: IS21 family transposase [Gemmatales bacterium]|nr:IS21 family transposase [Gemmatales bacterium]
MTCTKKQIRALFKFSKTLSQEAAANKAGMSLRTARNYLKAGPMISEKKEWKYRQTHPDAFEGVWDIVEEMLEINPGLQSQTIMQYLLDEFPDEQFSWSQLRTLQRRIHKWRGLKGPDKEVKFPQKHIPGKQSQSDWTNCNELGVIIDGYPFEHMLFHFMLPYSRWETAFISQSESFDNLTMGYMKAVAELGGVAEEHRTDNLSAAVYSHGSRPVFTERWKAFLEHYNVQPSMNNAGESHENGSVEKSHHLLKNALDQALMLRRSREFASVAEYEKFIRRILDQRNQERKQRLAEEMTFLKPLPEYHWNDPKEVRPLVTSFSTISVDKVVYSVPSRLIGRELRALVYPEVVRVFLGETLVQEMPRLAPGARKINYRHLIAHLVRKPGAFENYQYREDLFPSIVFRKAYDALKRRRPERANKEYLAVLHLAAMNSEQDVEAALEALLESNQLPLSGIVRELVQDKVPAEIPPVSIPPPELCSYDLLLSHLLSAPKERRV